MKHFLLSFLFFVCGTFALGQTPVSLPATPPYVQDFNTTPGASNTSYPTGWTSYNKEIIDNTMIVGTASSTTGANYNYGSRIGLLGSGSNFDPSSIVLAIDNTSGLSGLQLSYDVIKIREQGRDCTFNLEYSVTSPTSGFTTLFSGLYNSGTLAEGTITPYSNIDISVLDNQAGTVYLRWSYTSSGGGSRDGIALDNVSISWNTTPASIDLLFQDAGDPNIARGSTENPIFSARAIVTDAVATLNQVTLRTNGTYTNTDIAANGFKLWISTDGLFGGDTQLGTASSVSGNGETITFSSLSQTIPINSIRYFFITADITPSATLNNTVGIDNTTTADFVFASPNSKTGTAASGNLHTIIGLNTGTVATSICVTSTEGEPITVPFTYFPTATYTGIFTAELSDATGSFAFPTSIGTVASDNSGSQNISATIPANTAQGANYRIRVVSSVPNVEGADNGTDITIDLLNVSISPTATQNLTEFQNGDILTATESHSIQTRRWKYSTISGGPYTNFLGADPTERPYFETAGTYYIVCETEFACGKSSISNEVQINVSSFVGTRLFPGDVVIVGWDVNTSSGDDEFILTNLVTLTQGTTFQVVNATYENGSAADTRDNLWQDTKIMEFTYKLATPLAAGSTISFELPANISNPATNIRINNVAVPTSTLEGVRITGTETGGVNVSSTNPDQIFITQGSFQGTDFDGYVLFGMTHLSDWIDFSASVSAARTSRTPANIKCLNTVHTTAIGGSYYDVSALRNGSQREILSNIINMANWTDIPASATGRNIPTIIFTSTFTVSPNTIAEIEWIGGNSGTNDDNWFNCQNWENFYVPNRRQDVIMTTTAADGARININAFFSDEYNDLAEVKNIILEEQSLRINDSRLSKLDIYENLLIRNNGFLDMQDAIDFVEDGTINIRGDWTNEIGTVAFQEGQSLVVFEGGQNQIVTTAGGVEGFFDVRVNTAGGVTLNNEAIITTFVDGANIRGGHLEFISGNIFSNNSAYSVTFSEEATYEGASQMRHIRGTARRVSDKIEDFIFPIGKNGIYRPAIIHTQSGGSITTFFAEYFDTGYGTYNPVISPLVFVSQLEYWMINRESGTANAELTLSWGAESLVTNPASLVVTHWTDEVANPVGDEWVSRGQGFIGSGFQSNAVNTHNSITGGTGPINSEGRIRSAQTITAFSPFTLGSIDFTNLLPVTWLSFDAKYDKEQKNVLLEWATLSESQNQSFMIERSNDGIEFTQIGMEASSINSSSVKKYQFWDFEPLQVQTYYRIKQIDVDGNFSYSTIKMVEADLEDRIGITHYQGQTTLYANVEQTTKAKINIYDMNGNSMGAFDVVLERGQSKTVIPLHTLSTALYTYKIELENKSEFVSGKFLIK
ncbi:hypothetical protein [Bernardetia sp.]|uniref:hypothetical protein n=1 Tax=Bernardetia sp. TaxID=1937974 RepID=UPI0025B7FA5C|nr:hypothetical protein [Bernardetia sp.]